ncbi:hypothetical protein ACD578_26385 (plasmid) [Microvirga sp. RSM25]|uniref:hypothetical protein n=1 Tax=Microvirga sp. RSM25 TaxID=3273802 RepID=UPI00384C6484
MRGITRRLKAGWHRGDRLLCLDWTLLRLFPPLRATWALKGRQAVVPITGRNAKRVLFVGVDGPLTASLCQNEVVADLKDRRPSVDQIIRIGMDTSVRRETGKE